MSSTIDPAALGSAAGRSPHYVRVSATESTKVGGYLRDVLRHRTLIRVLVGRELKGAHEFNLVGFAWWLLEPLSFAAVYFTLIVVIFGNSSKAYLLTVFVALLAYKWLVKTVTGSIGTVRNNAGLVANVFFPRAFLPIAELMVGFAHYLVGLLIVPIFMLYYGLKDQWSLTPAILWLPAVIAVQFVFMLGLAFPAAAFGIHFKNVRKLSGNLMRLWFYLSPGLWALDRLTDPTARTLARLNPLTGIFESYRQVVTLGEAPIVDLWYSLGFGIVALVLGGWVFIRKERQFGKVAI